jgi:hypothetical protein
LRLYVNASHVGVADWLAAPNADRGDAVASVLRWDVARQLIELALDHAAFVDGFGDFDPDTVGGVLQRVFELWLPDRSPRELGQLREDAPGRFEALLQARLRMLTSP